MQMPTIFQIFSAEGWSTSAAAASGAKAEKIEPSPSRLSIVNRPR